MIQKITSNITESTFQVKFLLFYLGTIIVIGKGPTYINLGGQIYWGEIVMLVGLYWIFKNYKLSSLLENTSRLLFWAIIIFVTIGCFQLIFSFPKWGLMAIRDSSIWYYVSFYFIGLAIAQYQDSKNYIWIFFQWIWILSLVWFICDFVSGGILSQIPIYMPYANKTLLANSGSENLMHTGLAVLLLAFRPKATQKIPKLLSRIMIITATVIILSQYARGVKIAVISIWLLAFGVYTFRWYTRKLNAKVLPILFWIFLFFLVVFVYLGKNEFLRKTQFDRFLGAVAEKKTGTTLWREVWWENIKKQVRKENPLWGLGFGQSLSIYNPFLEDNEKEKWPVRSPHNINITILARMGYVGLAVWISILFLGVGKLIKIAWRGRVLNKSLDPEQRIEILFLVSMLIATWINSSFGLLMEGPVLGIPFWFFLGYAQKRYIILEVINNKI